MLDRLAEVDTALFLAVNGGAGRPAVDAVFVWLTTPRHWIAPIVVGVFLALVRIQRERPLVRMRPGWRRTLVILALCALAVAITDPLCARVLKPLFDRPRPCDPTALVAGARCLLGPSRGPAMPSNHAANTFAVATLLTCVSPRRLGWLLAVAALLSVSRVYVGVHYPADVAVGAGIGPGVGVILFAAWTHWHHNPDR